MHKKSVLVVCADPLHPVSGGGAARIFAMTDYLRQVGFRVELAIPYPGPRATREIAAKVDRLHTCSTPLNTLNEFVKALLPPTLSRPLARILEPMIRRRHLRLRKKLVNGNLSSFILRKINPDLVALTRRVTHATPHRAVIAQFAWTARCLDEVPKGVLKLLDTHDVQHLRRDRAREAGGDLPGHACTREEEIQELSRAEVLLAIQRHESKVLQELCPKKPIVLVEHSENTRRPLPSPSESQTVLFVGSLYDPNVQGLRLFMDTAWPKVRAAVPNAELRLCGTVCAAFDNVPDGVVKLGRVPELEPHYADAAVVINPVPYGSGLKIKSVEALAFGKCLVATPAGVSGLEEDANAPFYVSSIETMAEAIMPLLNDPARRAREEAATHEYARVRFSPQYVYRRLERVLRKGIRGASNGRAATSAGRSRPASPSPAATRPTAIAPRS